MFARVLFPTDFSAYADAVLACLPDLKPAGLGEVILLSVIRSSDVPMPETVNRDSLEYWRWSLEEKLNIARMALEGKGLRAFTRVEYGNPAEQIVRVAEDERVALIVLGAQGATAAQELLIGCTAYEVIRRATVPVLLQKFEIVRELGHVKCRQVCESLFRRVLHPTDFSDCADAAFQVVKRLKAAGTQEVIVLHVQDDRVMKLRPPEQLAEFDRHDTERLQALCKKLSMFGLQAQPVLRHGIPFKEALKVADEMDVSLIALGSHGYSAVREMLAGSTLENVARLSRQAVVVVRSQRS
ncbi:MAG: universal stress protein [Anaerolineales bacterium]|nr:universal stress protein [Anaerolineales bacterium]